jgi:hypothetical protein
MRSRFRATGILRAAREKLGRLKRVLMEAESSDEDLVFHIYQCESDHALRYQAAGTTIVVGNKPPSAQHR